MSGGLSQTNNIHMHAWLWNAFIRKASFMHWVITLLLMYTYWCTFEFPVWKMKKTRLQCRMSTFVCVYFWPLLVSFKSPVRGEHKYWDILTEQCFFYRRFQALVSLKRSTIRGIRLGALGAALNTVIKPGGGRGRQATNVTRLDYLLSIAH